MEDLNNSQEINDANLENINENSDNLSSINIEETFKTLKIRDLKDLLKNAYKKFKSYTYYNQYSAIDRLKLSDFEFKNFCKSDKFEIDEERLDQFFEELAEKVLSNNLNEFIEKVDVISLPKKMQDNKESDSKIFTNFSPDNFSVDKIHYFLDLPIEGHILGVLWILRCGYILDDKLYKNCYSNRINNKILNKLKNDQKDCSTFLFYPYFRNYESWRDNGLDEVTNILNKEQNAIMISLDIKDYYYASRINFKDLKEDMEKAKDKLENNKFNEPMPQDNWDDIDDILNCFVEHVFEAYHEKFSFNFSNNSIAEDSGYMIPLGFLPSLIIANWNLQGFDQAILENVHPNYYGRYADDILIVLPSHEKSDTHGNQFIEDLSLEDIIIKFLTPYNDPKNSILKKRDENKKDVSYGIENLPICSLGSEDKYYCYDYLEIQEDKFKVFLFNYKESQAMIKKFKKEIAINTSEFKLLHGVKSTFENLEYDLYRMDYEESINKLKDVNNFRLNKFEASKILSRLIDSSKYSEDIDKKEITKEILSAFYNDALSYINLWEKIFGYLYINNEISSLKKLIEHVEFLIDNIHINSDHDFNKFFLKSNNSPDKSIEINNLKKSLNLFLYSSIVRVLSLKFEKNFTNLLYEPIDSLASNTDNKYSSNSKYYDMLSEEFRNKISKLEPKYLFTSLEFLFSSLQNNNLMRFPILDIHKIINRFLDECIDLKDESDELNGYDLVKPDSDDYGLFNGYFYPRYVKFYECILNQINSEIFKKENNSEVNSPYLDESHFNSNEENNYDIKYILDESYSNYNKINSKSNNSNNKDYIVKPFSSENVNYGNNFEISISSEEKKGKVKVGLINTQLNYQDNINRIKNKPNLSYKRFDKIKNIINEAINKKVEFLVMPELYVPYEWIDKIVEVSRNHQMVIIFGLEYIVHEDLVKNYLMVSLPYTSHNGFKSSILTYRLKNHYAPSEINTIEDLNKKCMMNDSKKQNYILYNWKGISFVPYCCYEIADITARSLFKNNCHIVTISEFNKDTKYFDNICESLSRDLYCYCISSNTSKYGGTSIIQPSSSENKYIIRLKGGENDYIVTHDLNISDLKDKSLRSYSADYSDTHLKPQPPGLKKKFRD